MQSVDYSDDGGLVKLGTNQGAFEADLVVCTLPLGVLKQGYITLHCLHHYITLRCKHICNIKNINIYLHLYFFIMYIFIMYIFIIF